MLSPEYRRKRLHNIGVRLMETIPEIRMAAQMVTANSRNSRPRMPAMKRIGMKTAASESVMETIVKPISREPASAASKGFSPFSMWRTMFSSMTMASSTTNPMERISAIREMLFRLKSSRYITENVPTMENGSAVAGIMVAERFRRNRKITRTTSERVASMVNWMSWNASRMFLDRSPRMRQVDGRRQLGRKQATAGA